MPRKLILDVDTGTDDAIAIMLAAMHPELDLVAVTTVNGNAPVEVATDNTLRVLGLLGRDVPVHIGRDRPLIRPDFPVPRADKPERAVHALVMMAGTHAVGNVTPAAEFNVWADPDAARVVFGASHDRTTLITLDTTHSAPLDRAFCGSLRALDTPAGHAAADFVEQRIDAYRDRVGMANREAAPVHDPFAVASLVMPDLIETRRVFVDVETRGDLTMGRTVIDLDARSGRAPNVDFASLKEPRGIADLLLEVLAI